MSRVMDENGSALNESPVGLYKVKYEVNEIHYFIDLLLPLGRKNKTNIKKMVAIMTNIQVKVIKRVKLRFRKKTQGFISGISGTKVYNTFIQLQKEKKKQAAKSKRKYSTYVDK